MLNVKLTVVGGDAKSGDEVNLRLPTVVGRGKEAGLTIPHALVSRQHCEIFEREGQLVVRDCGSLNGTFINNTRLENEQILEPNQLLTLGNITFRAIYEVGINIGSDIALNPKSSQSVAVASDESALSEIDSFEPDDADSFAGISNVQSDVIAAQARMPAKPGSANEQGSPPSAPKVRDALKTQTVEDFIAADSPALAGSALAGSALAGSALAESDLADSDLGGSTPVAPASASVAASGIDLGIETGQSPVVAASSIDGLPVDDKPLVSFIGNLGDQPNASQIFDPVNIDVDGEENNRDIDEDRLGSFMKKLPK